VCKIYLTFTLHSNKDANQAFSHHKRTIDPHIAVY
jgi:hypothetical protein